MNDRASAVLNRSSGRVRKALIQECVREASRVHGLLEDAGIRLATVAGDVFGMSGRTICVPVEGPDRAGEAFRLDREQVRAGPTRTPTPAAPGRGSASATSLERRRALKPFRPLPHAPAARPRARRP